MYTCFKDQSCYEHTDIPNCLHKNPEYSTLIVSVMNSYQTSPSPAIRLR